MRLPERGEFLGKGRGDLLHGGVRALTGHVEGAQPGVAAGVDPGERLQVHRYVDGHAVISATVAHLEPEGRDFLARREVDARRTGVAHPFDAPTRQGADHRLLDALHGFAHHPAAAANVEQQIDHRLTGAVIGDLPAAIGLHHGNAVRIEQMLGPTGLALSEHRRMLHAPDLVGRGRVARIGQRPHGLPGRQIVLSAQPLPIQNVNGGGF